MTRRRRATIAASPLLPMLALLAGCGGNQDPIDRPGTWQPLGANDHNLRAMVADPNHLHRGVAAGAEHGGQASAAATRLLNDRRRPLSTLRATEVGVGGQGGQGDGGR